ncbi:MAG TPA: hypothetical protein DCM07_04065, partial [Planctomycetaceae bacterium]|nr:hypothetical protein [Planctomycetaceae bacterium]
MKPHTDSGDVIDVSESIRISDHQRERVMNDHTTQQADSIVSSDTACEVTDFSDEPVATADTTREIQQFYPDEFVGNIPPFPHLLRHPLKAAFWMIRMAFGIACLVLFLALIAAVPIVNFIALGYLLDVEGRVARTGKIRLAFPLLDIAPRLGMIVIGVVLWLIPLFLLAGAAADAHLIDPGGSSD